MAEVGRVAHSVIGYQASERVHEEGPGRELDVNNAVNAGSSAHFHPSFRNCIYCFVNMAAWTEAGGTADLNDVRVCCAHSHKHTLNSYVFVLGTT